jgi:hypothetical protein
MIDPKLVHLIDCSIAHNELRLYRPPYATPDMAYDRLLLKFQEVLDNRSETQEAKLGDMLGCAAACIACLEPFEAYLTSLLQPSSVQDGPKPFTSSSL